MHTDTYWDTIDFRPAPPGWELAFLPDDPDQPLTREPLPGWLVQEQVTFDTRTMEDLPALGRLSRRAVAALVVPGEGLTPASTQPNFWMELGPDTYITKAEVRQAVEKRNADSR